MAEGDRKIITIPFGEGLARSEGVMVVAPNTFDDIREFWFYKGRAQARKGLTESEILIDDVGAPIAGPVVALAPLRSENAAMGAAYDPGDDQIWVNRLDINGANASNVGSFGILDSATATFNPPIIIMADTDGKQFIAHDEPFYNARIRTKYYDSLAFPFLVDLLADLDGTGLAPVYFRGVARHLSYIFGWGYGNQTSGQEDRPSVVRVSTAGNVTQFLDDAFFDVGQQREPVMVCRSAGQFLMVFKETETHQIFGYSPDTFGVRSSDTLYGCVGSRLAVSVAGTVFFWSVQGPRATSGGASVDLAVPLDLDGPDPASLAAEGDVHNAFAEYDPATRVVQFVWGDRIYALSLRDPANPKWSYYEPGRTIQCGAQFFDTQSIGGSGLAPVDGPVFNAPPVPTINPTTAIIDWDNVGATGSEIVEIWGRVNTPPGPWSIFEQVASNLAASQTEELGDPPPLLVPLTTYDLAIRYRRGGQYNPGATDPDPLNWPVAAQTQFTTTEGVPEWVYRSGANQGLWYFDGANFWTRLNWTNPVGHDGLMIEVHREIQTQGRPLTQDLGSYGTGPPDSADQITTAETLLITLAPGSTQYDLEEASGGMENRRFNNVRLKYVGFTAFSSKLFTWAGPDPPAPNSLVTDSLGGTGGNGIHPPNPGGTEDAFGIFVDWTNASTPGTRPGTAPAPAGALGAVPADHETEAWANNMVADGGSNNWKMELGFGSPLPQYNDNGPFILAVLPVSNGTNFRMGIRHVITVGGGVYPSMWSKITDQANWIDTWFGKDFI